MERNLIRSDYSAGKPAWADWILLGIMLTISLSSFLSDGLTIITIVPALAAIGFGTFVVVGELGHLQPKESD
jgi:hypothetical protein